MPPKNLKINLLETYKSFPYGFQANLEGGLIIISGLNGSGKTQIIDVIRGYKNQDQNQKINRELQLDGQIVNLEEIVHKSFRDYSNISNITSSNVSASLSVKDTLWSWYKSNILSYENGSMNGHRRVTRDVKNLLIEKFGLEKFSSKDISEKEFRDTIPKDFVLYQDDIFTNKIGEIFFNHVSRVYFSHARASIQDQRFDPTQLPQAPWIFLNDLFKDLNFNYRFKNHYERNEDIINEQPAIYGLAVDGSVDETEKRSLEDLSDGEKAIISLVFAMTASEQIQPKVLLLDEYDATLNPSLIEALFKVLKTFFIDKGTQVIVVTHSSATISLAPKYANFYEVFKKDTGTERILAVSRDDYQELRKVYEEFYEKNKDQSARILEIIQQNNKLGIENALLKSSIDNLTKPLIITEGKTDVTHLKKALEKLNITTLDVVFFDQSALIDSLGSSKLRTKLIELSSVPHAQKIIGIFDRDEEVIVAEIGDLKDFGNNVYGMCIPKPSSRDLYEAISIEFYYSDHELKKINMGKGLIFTNEVEEVTSMTNKSLKEIRICDAKTTEEYKKRIYDKDVSILPTVHSKSVFAGLVESNEDFISDFNFENFRLIFTQIQSIIQR